MKRNYFLLSMIAAIAFMLTGCIQADFHTTVNKDGSADLDYKIGVDKSALGFLSASQNQGNPIDELKKTEENNGFQTSNYSDGNFVGVEGKKHVEHASDINSGFLSNNGTGNDNTNLKVTDDKHFFYDVYTLSANFDLTDLNKSSTTDDSFANAVTGAMMGKMDMKFRLTLPVKADQNNAGKVINDNGNTYEWTLLPGQGNKINLQAKVLNVGHIVIVAGITIVLIVAAVLLFRRKNKANKMGIAS